MATCSRENNGRRQILARTCLIMPLFRSLPRDHTVPSTCNRVILTSLGDFNQKHPGLPTYSPNTVICRPKALSNAQPHWLQAAALSARIFASLQQTQSGNPHKSATLCPCHIQFLRRSLENTRHADCSSNIGDRVAAAVETPYSLQMPVSQWAKMSLQGYWGWISCGLPPDL
jgi:hypothetical protein